MLLGLEFLCREPVNRTREGLGVEIAQASPLFFFYRGIYFYRESFYPCWS